MTQRARFHLGSEPVVYLPLCRDTRSALTPHVRVMTRCHQPIALPGGFGPSAVTPAATAPATKQEVPVVQRAQITVERLVCEWDARVEAAPRVMSRITRDAGRYGPVQHCTTTPIGALRRSLRGSMFYAFQIQHLRSRVANLVPMIAIAVLASCSAAGDNPTSPGAPPAPSGAGPAALVDMSSPAVALGGVGATETISVTIRDASGRVLTSPSVTWTSENSTIAEVTGNGASAILVARAPGVTRVRASSGNAAAYADVRVLGIRALSITPATLSVRLGDLQLLRTTVDGDAGVAQSVKWSTLNPSIATVDASGLVTGVGLGVTTVRASATADPTVIATANITVMPARTVSFAPGGGAVTLWVGDKKTVDPIVDVDSTQSRDIVWSSENASVATVDATGTITAIAPGTSIVYATSIADPRAKASVLVTVLPARAVTVTPASLALSTQQRGQLNAAVTIDNGLSTSVVWSSTDPSVATVSGTGQVTGIAPGVAVITATSVGDPTRSGTSVVTVTASIRSVAVTPAAIASWVGDQDQLIANVVTDGPLPRTVTWRSNNPSVANVSSTGLVSSMAIGQTTITAISTVDTTMRASAQVTVAAAPLVGVSPSSVSMTIGELRTLTPLVTVAPGVSTAVTWRSSAPLVASVNSGGTVLGATVGTTVITMISVADTMRRATSTITVVPIVRSVSVTPANAAGFVGDVITLSANVVADGALPRTVSWRTSNSAVATVSSNGSVALLSSGGVTITAVATADTTKRGAAQLVVGTPSVFGITLTPTSANLFIGQGAQLNAVVTAGGSLPTTFTLRSSNPAVASVNATGLVTAITAGNTTITATSVADTTRRATASITVASRPITVAIAPRPVTISPNQTQQLSATVVGDLGVSTSVTWTSAAPAIATISGTGLVTAVTSGSARITAVSSADPTKQDTLTVTVSSMQLATSWASTRLGGALFEDVISTVGFGASAAFAVNVIGDVYRWDGNSWSLSARGSTYGGQFLSVHGSALTNVIAVGTGGIVARFDGSSWSSMSSGSTRVLTDVWVEGVGAAYAVGANGTALRLSGSAWAATSTGSTQTLNGVWSTSGTVFAVGNAGEALRYNGSTWTRLLTRTTETLYSVAGTSTSSVIAVGSVGTIIRFDGTTWTIVSNGVSSADLYSVSGSSANGGRMFIAGDGGLLQLDGSALSVPTTPYRPRLYSAAVDAAGTVWTGGQRGSAMRNVSGTWTTTSLAPDLLDVSSTSSSSAWAVGEFGFIYRWNGSSWSRQPTPTTVTLNTVWGASASDAFAGGESGTMLRFNGSSWTTMTFPSSASVTAIWGASSSDVYATTSSGQVLRFNGSVWSISATTANPLWGIYGLASGEVFASGENGTLLRFNGSGWTSSSPTSSGVLVGVWGSGSSNLLTVGVDASGIAGVAFRFTGAAWGAQSVGTSRVLTSVWGPTASDIYVTGEQGTMLRFNGTSWQTMSTGTTELLWSMSGSPTGSGAAFAVGYNSTLVTGSGSGPFVAGAMRTNGLRSNLEPSAAARLDQRDHALPDGAARRARKGAARASGARVASATVPAPASIKFRLRGTK